MSRPCSPDGGSSYAVTVYFSPYLLTHIPSQFACLSFALSFFVSGCLTRPGNYFQAQAAIFKPQTAHVVPSLLLGSNEEVCNCLKRNAFEARNTPK